MPCHTQTSWSEGHESREDKGTVRQEGKSTRSQIKLREADEEGARREDSQAELSGQEKGKEVATYSPTQKIRNQALHHFPSR